jgi:chromate transporter
MYFCTRFTAIWRAAGAYSHFAARVCAETRNYITEEELMELNALAQVLPGPSSTQTLVGIAWKVGGLRLAIITFLIWILPSAAIMCGGYKL